MRIAKFVIALLALVWSAGCSFQSDVILPVADAAGDAIPGLPADAPFKLESFDRDTQKFRLIGTMTPTKADAGRMRYTFMFNGESDQLAIRAQKVGDNAYVLRYAETGKPDAGAGQTALVFLTEDDGTYYVLTSLADQKLYDKVYTAGTRPEVRGDDVKFATIDQAKQLADYFVAHRSEFLINQDYIQMRVARP
jgi:hypothetical protein